MKKGTQQRQNHCFKPRTIAKALAATILSFLIPVVHCYAQYTNKKVTPRASLQDSLAVYNNAKTVQAFYENTGKYTKTRETRLNTDDPAPLHAGNDKKYDEVLRTIANDRLTPQGKRKIQPEEYRVNMDKYRYKQRELSDYVLNTDAPMQLFDRRIAPQLLVDYSYTGNINNALNADDVDFKMYDPVAVKPYSLLTSEERKLRDTKYPPVIKPNAKTTPVIKDVKVTKNTSKPDREIKADFMISGDVPDSVRNKRFKTRREAEEFIKTLPRSRESE
jgi:hypothetical protein